MAKKNKESEENINDENQEFNDIDENFGLPDLEYQPADDVEDDTEAKELVNESENEYSTVEDEESESYAQESKSEGDTQNGGYVPGTYTQKMMENSDSGGKTTGIIVSIVLVLAIASGAYYWFMIRPDQIAAEKAKQEQLEKEAADKRKKEDYDKLIVKGDGEFGEESWNEAALSYRQASALYPQEQYPQDQLAFVQNKLDSITTANAKPAIGEIETITERMQRYHIIVSSSIDGDLAMDYAKKISASGTNVGIIAPFGGNKYYRLTLGNYPTWQDAENAVSSFSGAYGNGIWILKY